MEIPGLNLRQSSHKWQQLLGYSWSLKEEALVDRRDFSVGPESRQEVMKIWRGDSDSSNVRQLKMTVERAAGLLSNMTNNGNPMALAQQGFLASIQRHVSPGWVKTHFLSFSKSKATAELFAAGISGKCLRSSSFAKWDAITVEIDLSKLNHINNIAPGMEHFSFAELGLNQNLIPLNFIWQLARQQMFANRPPILLNILVIDVHQHLLHLQSSGAQINPQALAFALNDEEILVLPLDPLPGSVGLTGLLDFGCVTKLEFHDLI